MHSGYEVQDVSLKPLQMGPFSCKNMASMRIAIISDIHGNLPALEAAVADAERRSADRIVCAGDLVGYGPFPTEVCAFIEDRGIDTVLGNYDRKVIESIDRPGFLEKKMKSEKRKVLEWTRKHTVLEAARFLRKLPPRISMRLPGSAGLLVVHGSPLSDVDNIYPSVTARGLSGKLGVEKPDVLACGHTHIPFARSISGVAVVNCGSAGFPVDGDPRPSYALLDAAPGRKPSVRLVRFSYDVARVVEAIGDRGLPESLCRDFIEGSKRRELQ